MLLAACGTLALAQNTRYNVDYDSNSFPQDTPKTALASVLRALNERRVDYLLAQLTDPEFVDDQVVNVYAGKFDELVKAVKMKLSNDPDILKNLARFASDGDWEMGETAASVKLKDLREKVFFRKIGSRWFFENKKSADKDEKKDKEK
jgi:hypothetical protein